MSCVRISQNLLNQPIKYFFDLLGSCYSNRPNWNIQWDPLMVPVDSHRNRPQANRVVGAANKNVKNILAKMVVTSKIGLRGFRLLYGVIELLSMH